ncbi:MAG: ribonuclease J [Alphaproteobacteria bacterium]|nr:ribonuclease J [Alphaproteobacteria bacterium]
MTAATAAGPADLADAGALYFLALGGSGEIGMNLNLYGHAGKWLMIDLGITFADDSQPALDVIMPDPAFIEAERDKLVGLVLTHAHEDHLGAVPYLWERLRCPVYATPFAAAVLRRKLKENGGAEVPITEVPLSARFTLGPFDLELITLTHSIPEPNAVAIRTRAGTVLHTGDWKLDDTPLVGDVTDETALRALGEEGVLAMVCDSTNAMREGTSGSEGEVRESLGELVGRFKNRVAVASFASNVARLETMAAVAEKHDRHCALIGRSLWRMQDAARATGYLAGTPPFVSEHDAGYLPRDKVLLVCTGSQGEQRAALSRIVADSHPHIVLERGDAVIFSSRIIPGNERTIHQLQNRLIAKGIEVITERDHFVHVSGHPARDELTRMYQWVRPRIAVPVHGEARHIAAHAALARDCQVQQAIEQQNGQIVRLAPGPAEVVGTVAHGRLALDGTVLRPIDSPVLRDRHRLMYNGSATATVVVDDKGRLAAPPRISARGLVDAESEQAALDEIADAVRAAIEALPRSDRGDDDAVAEAARRAVRRTMQALRGHKPVTDVHVVRV